MKRRRFLEATAKAGLLAGAHCALGAHRAVSATERRNPPYDLVAAKGSSPDRLFDTGILALGGMTRFVKPGQTVVIKPNIAWDLPPERAANTNPHLVKRIVEHCRAAGARKIFVFDFACDDWRRSYRSSGIQAAVRAAGGTMAPGGGERYFHPVSVGGRKLKQAKEHELVLESDVFINVPVLKSHAAAGLSSAMKNLMGIVWDRGFWHRTDLHQCIADFAAYRRPDLNVVDAYKLVLQNGPRGISLDDVYRMKAQLISPDIVAIDAAATKLFGRDPHEMKYLRLAEEQGAGRIDLEKLAIKRIHLSG